MLRTQSDDRLVDLVREGNDRAFEAIVHRYRRPLQRYCGRYLSAARAEDALQQTFVNAFAAIRDGASDINLRPWLYRIAHNASLNVLRQAGADHDEISEQIDGVETPPQAFERGERFRSVITAVNDLPERQRDALVLQALEGRSYEEIAGELGVTGGAVRQLLNRARTTIRQTTTAVTPPALLARLGGAVDAPVAERVAQVVAGAGGGAALAKGLAVLAVAGSVVGGTIERVIPGVSRAGDGKRATAKAKAAGGASAAAGPQFLAAAGGAGALAPGGRASVIDLRTGGRRTAAQRGSVHGSPNSGGARGGTNDGGLPHAQQPSNHSGHGPSGSSGDSHSGDRHSGSDSSGPSHDDHPSSGDGSGDSSGKGPSTSPADTSGDGSDHSSTPPTPAVAPAPSGPGPSPSSGKGSGKGSDDPPEPPEDPTKK